MSEEIIIWFTMDVTPTYSPTIRPHLQQQAVPPFISSHDFGGPSPLSSPSMLSLTPTAATTPIPPVFLLNINTQPTPAFVHVVDAQPPVIQFQLQPNNNNNTNTHTNTNTNTNNNNNNNTLNTNNNNTNINNNNNNNNNNNSNNNNNNSGSISPTPTPNSLSVPSTPSVTPLSGNLSNFTINSPATSTTTTASATTTTSQNQSGVLRRIAVSNNVQRSNLTIEDEQVVPRDSNSPLIASCKKRRI
ncbi:hypothetical protein PPL_11298 [Heterostelium album PN500]|uniref:Uncharacterized protein n=1 Tax=Heterostelium pallidum (strain ATCC 26659 / Pp 5 / PN500) TaxID=670386 RepID=D3BU37_HETP5|nr:hypothetical protein PPL_11298 [Heterostelium album PN500]EFA75223.1 hypothetical protein PPL_11298 [Heterostelium album PN500]|eukprot:XP_020427357.1 hypothetical protein PPL_11298 [Heterostelium album PN500]